MDWTGVVWIVMCLSVVWTHSDGTHLLQRTQWWTGDEMLNFSKSVLIKKLFYILDGLRVSNFKENLNLGWNIPKFSFFSKPRRFEGAKRSKMLLRDVTFSKGKHFMWRNEFMKRVLLIRKLQQRCKWNLKTACTRSYLLILIESIKLCKCDCQIPAARAWT